MKTIREISRKDGGWEVRTDEGKRWHQEHLMNMQHVRTFRSKYLLVAYAKAKFSKKLNEDTNGPQI